MPAQTRTHSLRLWAFCALALCIAGVGLRFYHLDWKVYAFDETVTAIRASGHSIAEFSRFIGDNRTHDLAELRRFQQYDPTSSYVATVLSLATEEPQHPPLYFLIARAVSSAGAASIWWRRFPAAVFAALLIPAFWLLAFALFESKSVAWTASALVAVSPFHLAYAQQNREYSLWALLTVVSSTLLLAALRSAKPPVWVAYTLALVVSLWCYTFAAYVLLAHALYVLLASEQSRRNRRAFTIAAFTAIAAFSPWLFTIMANSARIVSTTAWDSAALPLKISAAKWLFNLSAVFFDLDYLSLRYAPVAVLVATVACGAVVVMIRRTPRATWAFVVLLGGVCGVAVLAPDIVLRQSHSTESRYLTPLWLALELAVAYVLGTSGWGAAASRATPVWRLGTVALVALGLVSGIVSSQARYWWLASDVKAIPAIATVLNERDSPGLIAYAGDDFYLLELCNVVHAPIRFKQGGLVDRPGERNAPVYIIGKAAQISEPMHAFEPLQVRRIALPAYFPQQDRTVTKLRAEGAAARDDAEGIDDVALWTIAPIVKRAEGMSYSLHAIKE